jgi:hypothetical protein
MDIFLPKKRFKVSLREKKNYAFCSFRYVGDRNGECLMITRYIQENSALKWLFHGVFVAVFVLFAHEVKFYHSSKQIASSFVEATQGLVLFEMSGKDFSQVPRTVGGGRLESFVLQPTNVGGAPFLKVETDTISGSFVKLEHAKKIETKVLQGTVDKKITGAAKVYYATVPDHAVGMKKEFLKAISKKEVSRALRFTLYEESALIKNFGWKGAGALLGVFVLLNTLFASVYRRTVTGILNLRFFGVPSSTIVPLMLARNGLLLLCSFGFVWFVFQILGAKYPFSLWVWSFIGTFSLSAFWSFFGTVKSRSSFDL